MPLPNGIDPWGRIAPTCPHAALMGNRGILHGEDGVIARPFAHKGWVACEMSYGNRNRQPLMQPKRYSELFFLDEATALAAGHRPCGECRRRDYANFKAAWFKAHPAAELGNAIQAIDRVLHDARVTITRDKKTWRERMAHLPPGTMVEIDGAAHLYWHGALLAWTPAGYVEGKGSGREEVTVLTPRPVVAVLAAGYVPRVHASAIDPRPA